MKVFFKKMLMYVGLSILGMMIFAFLMFGYFYIKVSYFPMETMPNYNSIEDVRVYHF